MIDICGWVYILCLSDIYPFRLNAQTVWDIRRMCPPKGNQVSSVESLVRRFDKVLNFLEATYEISLLTRRKTLALHIPIHAFMGRIQHPDRYCTDLDLSIGKHYTTPPTLDDSVGSHPDDFRCGTLRAGIS